MSTPAYHLAWYLPHVAGVSQGATVRYLLVPVALEKFQATRTFQVIGHNGRVQGEVETFPSKVITLRTPGTPKGVPSAQELLLISALKERAVLAGLEQQLPVLRPLLADPVWARAVIDRGTRLLLESAGGA